MSDGYSLNASCSNYWYNNGVNTTLIGFENKFTLDKKFNAAIFSGVALDTKSGGSMVIDLKASHNYDNKGIIGHEPRISAERRKMQYSRTTGRDKSPVRQIFQDCLRQLMKKNHSLHAVLGEYCHL